MSKVIKLETAYALMKVDSQGMIWAVSVHDTEAEAKNRKFLEERKDLYSEFEIWTTRYTNEDEFAPPLDEAVSIDYEIGEPWDAA